MPKLLQINTVVSFASTGKIAEALGKKVIESGWESYIAHGRHPNKSFSKTIQIGNKYDFYWHAVMTRLFDLHGLSSRKATKKLIKDIEAVNPDIIHLHNVHGYYVNYPILFDFLQKLNKPIVWTLHDCWSLTGHCTHYEHAGCYKWQETCHKCPQLLEYPKTYIWDRTRKNHQLKKYYFNKPANMTIVTVSKWLEKQVKLSGLKNILTKVIYNGINTKKFKVVDTTAFGQKHNPDEKFLILGVAGNWTKNKGLDDFLALRKKLDSNYKMVLIGLNTTQVNNLPKEIIGIERTESVEELVNWYNLANVYINTSVEETFGMTTAEAMACGTPVIVYNATACPEIVTEDVGFVARKNNLDDILDYIGKIKSKGNNHFTKICQDYVIDNFEMEDKFDQYVALYNKLLQKQEL